MVDHLLYFILNKDFIYVPIKIIDKRLHKYN